MSFFGAVFAATTLALQLGWRGSSLAVPFAAFAAILAVAIVVDRRPGQGVVRSRRTKRVIIWSTIGEGCGLLVVANLVVDTGHLDLLLPATALIVGLHFLPMGYLIPFRPFLAIGIALLVAAAVGLASYRTQGGTITGFASACILWAAAILAVHRELRAKVVSGAAGAS